MLSRPATQQYRRAENLIRRLQKNGHRATFVGGCVRDMLLGTTPVDYDIATSARPEQVEKIFRRTIAVGRQFGVIIVLLDGDQFEVATFRSDTEYTDGRHPDGVRFEGIEADARRRDFTINGMYWDPRSGELIDLVGGQASLRDRTVEAIGEPGRRFDEDHLRLIRTVRFAARLDFQIAPSTRQAASDRAELVTDVAAERLQQELRIILSDRAPAAALRLMDDMGMLTRIFPELKPARGCDQPDNYHPEGDVFTHTLLTVEKLGPHPDFRVSMAALLHDIGKPPANRGRDDLRFPRHDKISETLARKVCRRLKLPNRDTERICWLVKRHMYLKDARKMKDSTLRQLFAQPGFEQLCRLARADALASWGKLDNLNYVLRRREKLSEEEIDPPRLITGHDLIEMGYTPGPAFGKILDTIREAQLEGELEDREAALKRAREIADDVVN
ncbi:MAG: CCA tRNA nucleotidyltransferase [Planctomycetota bacterium]